MGEILSTYLEFGRGQFDSIKRAIGIGKEVEHSLHFEVFDGRQCGSTAVLDKSSIQIGSGWQDDLLLSSLEESTISLTCHRSMLGLLVKLSTDHEGIAVNGVPVKRTHPPISLPVKVCVGPECIQITEPSLGLKGKPDEDQNITFGLIGLCAVLGVGLLALASQLSSANKLTVVRSETSVEEYVDPMPSAEEIIAASGLVPSITISAKEGGPVIVKGKINESQSNEWSSLRGKLEALFATTPLTYDIGRAAPLSDVPAFSHVVLGSDPFLILKTGQRVNIGDKLFANWTLTDLTDTFATVSNGVENIEIFYSRS